MAAEVEAGALAGGGCAAEQERLGAALVAALELALVSAHRLLGELDTAAGRRAEAAAHLERALALAGSDRSPHERALALLVQVGPHAATGEPTAAGAQPAAPCTRPASLDAAPPSDGAARPEARGTKSVCAPPACLHGLTAREGEVLRLIVAGRSNREIAASLCLSVRTAERHIENLFRKTDTHSKAEATAYAFRHRLV